MQSRIAEVITICLPKAQTKTARAAHRVVSQQRNSIFIRTRKADVEMFSPDLVTIEENGYQHIFASTGHFRSSMWFGSADGILSGPDIIGYSARQNWRQHIPCLVRDLSNSDGADGFTTSFDWLMMPRRLLESANPPTVAHFLRGRGHDVMMRATSLVVQVRWACHVMPDEYECLKRRLVRVVPSGSVAG